MRFLNPAATTNGLTSPGDTNRPQAATRRAMQARHYVVVLGLLLLAPLTGLAATASLAHKTGFMVVAADRGHLGNQELKALMTQFKQTHPASLALVGKNRQGVEANYTDYIQRALTALKQQGVTHIVAIPLFFSEANATFRQYQQQISGLKGAANIQWAQPMSHSYLTAQILLDRVEALSKYPARERLVVLGAGATDEASARHIKQDLEAQLKEVTDRHQFREVTVHVYYNRDARGDIAKKNNAIDEQIIRSAAKRGRTLLVPFSIGSKFDQRMSMEGWLKRKFADFDINLGGSLLPHPQVLTWLQQTANRHSVASREQLAVLIMPHGSTQPYNDGLEKVIAPLRKQYRIEVAPGMADPLILGQAVQKLEQEGFTRIIFVRMYALQDHMKAKTDYLLGLSTQPPQQHHGELPPRIRSSAVFTTFGGYEEDPLIAEILQQRILEVSKQPEKETVILLAHGKSGDAGDQRWLNAINGNIERIQQDLSRPFRSIKAMTLREDWPEKRAQALKQIKDEIKKGNQDGGRVLVISNRLYGSGPYRRLLKGSTFVINDQGLVPHSNMTRWLKNGIQQNLKTALQAAQPGSPSSATIAYSAK